MTDLIDVLMETARQTGFLDAFTTSGDRVVLDEATLRQRLVLCLYSLGTNAGLKRVSAGMLQRVRTEPAWLARMTAEDHRGLTPAIHAHINPYGRFDADLGRRIDLGLLMAA